MAACAPENGAEPEPPADQATTTDTEAPEFPNNGLPDPPAPRPPRAEFARLIPLSEAQIGAEMRSGATCDLADDGAPILVATRGDAIVNDGGRIVHLKPEAEDWNALVDGGRFIGKDIVVEINAGSVVARSRNLVARGTDVDVRRGRYGFKVFHGPRWICWS